MTAIHEEKRAFVNDFARLSGFSPRFVAAWVQHEQSNGSVLGGNNWLNIETGEPGGGSGPYGASSEYVERHTAAEAAQLEYEWLKKYQPQILSGKTEAQRLSALESSGYAGSGYGGQSLAEFLSFAPSNEPERQTSRTLSPDGTVKTGGAAAAPVAEGEQQTPKGEGGGSLTSSLEELATKGALYLALIAGSAILGWAGLKALTKPANV